MTATEVIRDWPARPRFLAALDKMLDPRDPRRTAVRDGGRTRRATITDPGSPFEVYMQRTSPAEGSSDAKGSSDAEQGWYQLQHRPSRTLARIIARPDGATEFSSTIPEQPALDGFLADIERYAGLTPEEGTR
jgi:hypothetical protein